MKGRLTVQGGYKQSDVAVDYDAARHLDRGASCGAPFSRPHRQALESSSEDHGIPPRDKGYGFDFCRQFGIGSDCI